MAAQLSGTISTACLTKGRPMPKNWAGVSPNVGVIFRDWYGTMEDEGPEEEEEGKEEEEEEEKEEEDDKEEEEEG